jgi:hypothetical protein
MFQGVLVKLKQSGLGETQHTEPIDPEDLAKLYDSAVFSDSNATGLQYRVLFEHLYYFCNRGRENLREIQ